jgi:hypothetical protein
VSSKHLNMYALATNTRRVKAERMDSAGATPEMRNSLVGFFAYLLSKLSHLSFCEISVAVRLIRKPVRVLVGLETRFWRKRLFPGVLAWLISFIVCSASGLSF